MSEPRVVVVGGGLAGCAAATVLTERGVKVTIVEREGFLGGRAGAWADQLADGTPFQMERGFHAFFRNYKNLRALLARVDPSLSFLKPLSDYPLLGPDGREESFANLTTIPVLNVAQLVLRSSSLALSDLRHADLDRARAMLMFERASTYETFDGMTAKEFLTSLRFPPRAKQMLFDVFAHSFFNPEEDYSAAELLSMFHFYFLRNRDGLVFDVLSEPFSTAFFAPLSELLSRRGAELRLGVDARGVERRESGFVVQTSTGPLPCDGVVLALHVPGLRALDLATVLDAEDRARIASLDVTAPFAVWRLFLDAPLARSRAPFAGTTGLGILDNVSIYEHLEGESARWARRTGGSVVELHAYAVDPAATEEGLQRELLAGLHAAYPEARSRRIIESRFILRQDCPSFRPNSDALRPGVRTATAGLVLAGDFVKLPFPSALMERATSSGMLAANALLERMGRRGVAVLHGPLEGPLARLGRGFGARAPSV